MRSIHFIASYPRSGNTWVRAFLFALLRRQGHLPSCATLLEIDRYMPWEAQDYVFEAATGRKLASMPRHEALLLRPKVHRWLARHWPTPPIVKTHSIFGNVAGRPMFDLGVTQGALYLVRNPLHAIPSLAGLLGIPMDEAISVAETRLYATASNTVWGSWSENVASWVDHGPQGTLVIRFEDLMSDPVPTFTSIVADMGLPATEDDVAAAAEAVRLEHLRERHAAGEVFSPGWKTLGGGVAVPVADKLTAKQIDRITAAHGPLMERFGYSASTSTH